MIPRRSPKCSMCGGALRAVYRANVTPALVCDIDDAPVEGMTIDKLGGMNAPPPGVHDA